MPLRCSRYRPNVVAGSDNRHHSYFKGGAALRALGINKDQLMQVGATSVSHLSFSSDGCLLGQYGD